MKEEKKKTAQELKNAVTCLMYTNVLKTCSHVKSLYIVCEDEYDLLNAQNHHLFTTAAWLLASLRPQKFQT